MGSMSPGDILLLGEAKLPGGHGDAIFLAVLACPRCGHLTPIMPSQYAGGVAVMCSSNRCSCRFRIAEQSRLVHLPVM